MRRSRPFAAFLLANLEKRFWFTVATRVALGILIGTLIGFSLNFEYESEFTQLDFVPRPRGLRSNGSLNAIHLRCVVYIDRKQEKKSKYVTAVRDTYTKRCNETIIFTNSKDIHKQFAEELEIIYVETWRSEFYWELFRHIIQYLSKIPVKRQAKDATFDWTVIGNEQMYIVVENLKRYLLNENSDGKLIFGTVAHRRNLLSLLFPFGAYTSISLQAGIVFTRQSLSGLASGSCSGWFFPSATEKAIIECASLTGVRIIEPKDSEGMKLFHSENLKTIIKSPGNVFSFPQEKTVRAECCSDSAISFGSLNYKELLLMEYVVNKAKVFGIQIA